MSMLQSIWDTRIAPSAPVAYAKNVYAAAPGKVEELNAMREEYFKKIEATLETLKARAVKLPTELTCAITAAIAEARAKIDDAQLFERVKAAYETVLKYPAVVAAVEKATPVAARAVEISTPYYNKAVEVAGPYVTKVGNVAAPYVKPIMDRMYPPAAAKEMKSPEKKYPSPKNLD